MRHASSSIITIILPIDFTRLVFTLILAYWLFGETLDVWTGIGAIIILSSAVYMTHHEEHKKFI